MNIVRPENLENLQINIEHFLTVLMNINELAVHNSIDQFYYMQKKEELNIMKDQLAVAFSNIQIAQDRLEDIQRRTLQLYQEVFSTWNRDFHWLQQHLGVGE